MHPSSFIGYNYAMAWSCIELRDLDFISTTYSVHYPILYFIEEMSLHQGRQLSPSLELFYILYSLRSLICYTPSNANVTQIYVYVLFRRLNRILTILYNQNNNNNDNNNHHHHHHHNHNPNVTYLPIRTPHSHPLLYILYFVFSSPSQLEANQANGQQNYPITCTTRQDINSLVLFPLPSNVSSES